MIAQQMQSPAFKFASARRGAAGEAPAKATSLEYAFGFIAVLLYQGAFFPLLRAREADQSVFQAGGDPIARVIQGLVLLVLLLIIYVRRSVMMPALIRAKPYLLVIAYCLLSSAWSLFPMITIRRTAALTSCFFFGYYAFTVYGARNTVRLLATASISAATVTLILAVVAPSFAIDNALDEIQAGSLKGVFTQKNELSINMLMGFCNCIYLSFLAPDPSAFDRRVKWAMPILLIALVKSRGLTSEIALVFAFVATLFFFVRKTPKPVLVVGYLGLLLGLIVIAFLAFDPATILGLFGKDTSISGRGPIWEEALAAIKERPFFGYGYASFWLPDSIITQYIWSRVKWNAPSAHNGFLELALDIGIVGLTFYMYMIGRLVILTIRAIRLGGAPEARWLSLFLIAMLIENFDEGTLAWPDLMASTVAFGSAMTDSWWRTYRQNRSETKPPTRFPTWAEQFAGSSVAARPADHLA